MAYDWEGLELFFNGFLYTFEYVSYGYLFQHEMFCSSNQKTDYF